MAFLALPPGDIPIAEAALDAAVKYRREEQKDGLDYLAATIAQRIRAMFP